MSFIVQHSYYWRRGGHLKATKTEASAKVLPMHLALKGALPEWKSQSDYNGPGDFVFPSCRHKGKKLLDLAAVLKRKIQPAFVERRNHWRRLAHVSAHGRDHAGRDGGTSTHDPRLLAAQQSPCDEQVSSSNVAEQTLGAREVGRCDLAGRFAFGEQLNSHSVVGARERVLGFARGNLSRAVFLWLIGPKRTQIFFWGCCKRLKIWRGRRDSNSRPLP
jgi:hypothetical protein